MRTVLLALCLSLVLPAAAAAGPIERACLASGRTSDGSLCGCIQAAADRTLTQRDQRTAARFFRDPDRAQQIRMSDRSTDRAFWERYKSFGDYAEVVCATS